MSAARNTISRCLVLFVLLAILGLQANSVAAAKEPETGIDRIPEVGSSISHEHEAQSVKNWDWSIWPGPTYRSPKEKFTTRFQGRILYDFGTLRDQKSVGSTDGWETNLRILRVGLAGTIGRTIGYQVNLSIDNGDFNVQEAFIQYSGSKNWTLRAGQFQIANSLEGLTSSLAISLVERASFINAFGLKRALGAGARYTGKNWDARIGFFNGSNLNEDTSKEKYVASARVAVYPTLSFISGFHLAASYRYRKFSFNDDKSSVQYRTRPHTQLVDQYYVDTGVLDQLSNDQLFIFEIAGTRGAVWAAAEWGWLNASIVEGSNPLINGKNSARFHGGYASIGWFITGENRPQNDGKWASVQVNRPVFNGGWGAWAITVRYDYMDLVASKIELFGGTQSSLIFGLNWHLTNYIAVKFNLAHSSIRDAFGAPQDNGLVDENGRNKVNSFTTRLQVHF